MKITKKILLFFIRRFNHLKYHLFQLLKKCCDFLIFFAFRFANKKTRTVPKKIIVFYLPKFYSSNETDFSVDYFQILMPLRKYLIKNKFDYEVIEIFHDSLQPFSVLSQLNLLNQHKPAYIIFGSFGPKNYQFFGISLTLIHLLKKHGYIKSDLVNIGWDTISSNYWTRNEVNKHMDKILIVDNPAKLNVPCNYNVSKYFFLPPPLFKIELSAMDSWSDLDFSFVGSVGSYRDYRTSYLAGIKELNRDFIVLDTTSRDQQVSRKEYFEILSGSKISINFSGSVGKVSQLKGRVWEILLSGSMLLEDSNTQINQYFTNNIHFVSFNSEIDLISKINFYLENEELRKAIARRGQKRALELLGTDIFFDSMFKVNVD